MANKITLVQLFPVIWEQLELEPTEVERPISSTKFESIMRTTETIVSPSVIKRMWSTLRASDYSKPNEFNRDSLILDVQAIRGAILASGMTSPSVNTHTTHTMQGASQ